MRPSFVVACAAVVLSTAAAFAAACGGSSSSASPSVSDGGDDAGDSSAACSAYATARCQKLDACTNGFYAKKNFLDESACIARETISCQAALVAVDTSATAAFFTACAATIAARGCPDFFDDQNVPQACLAAPGARANGKACSFNAQCQSTWCEVPQGEACGSCAERPAAGAACSADSDCGQRGLFCAKSGVCAAPVAVGGACDDARPCGFATSCVGQTKTGPGTCQVAGSSAGASCDAKKETGPGCQANAGLYCTADGQCAAESIVSPPAACGRIDMDAGADDGGDAGKKVPFAIAVCASGAVCEPVAATTGNCVAAAADGEPCDRVNGPPCLAPARCVVASDAQTAGTCQLPGAASCQ